MERAYHIMLAKDTFSKFEVCEVLIRPKNIGAFGMFSLRNVDAIFHLGYSAAKEALVSNKLLESPLAPSLPRDRN